MSVCVCLCVYLKKKAHLTIDPDSWLIAYILSVLGAPPVTQSPSHPVKFDNNGNTIFSTFTCANKIFTVD